MQTKKIEHLSAIRSGRSGWRIGNPVQTRDGTATVCGEVPHTTKVSHWEQS